MHYMNAQNSFLETQLKYERVKSASIKYDKTLSQIFDKHNLTFPTKNIYIRIFKKERQLEVWASDNLIYTLIKTYSFTAFSGKLGPKQKEGDLQIPEGFYLLEKFNPASNFYLSMKVNYPNNADKIRNKLQPKIGGDIFIHGSNKTIGCVPIGDENIAELYWLCAKQYSVNTKIPIHIFPCKMEKKEVNSLVEKNPQWENFWKSLQPMYLFFQSTKMLGEVTGTDNTGNYQLAIPWD